MRAPASDPACARPPRAFATGRLGVVAARRARVAAIRGQADAVRRAAIEAIVAADGAEADEREAALAWAAMLMDGARQMERDAAALERTLR